MKISKFSFMQNPYLGDALTGASIGGALGVTAGALNTAYNMNQNIPEDEKLKQQQIAEQANTSIQQLIDNQQQLKQTYGRPNQGRALALGGLTGGALGGLGVGLLMKRRGMIS